MIIQILQEISTSKKRLLTDDFHLRGNEINKINIRADFSNTAIDIVLTILRISNSLTMTFKAAPNHRLYNLRDCLLVYKDWPRLGVANRIL